VREELLGRGGERVALDAAELVPVAIEHGDTRQRHRGVEHADHEQVVLDVVHPVVAPYDLRVVERLHEDGRQLFALRVGGCSQRRHRQGDAGDRGDEEDVRHPAPGALRTLGVAGHGVPPSRLRSRVQ
jgi:hypothetical protein